MSVIKNGSMYLDGNSEKAKISKKRSLSAMFTGLLAFIMLGLLLVPAVPFGDAENDVVQEASAGMLCTQRIGSGMAQKDRGIVGDDDTKFGDDRDRVLAVNEAFGGAAAFASYNGEGGGGFWVTEVKGRVAKAQENRPGILDSEDQKDKLESVRNGWDCPFNSMVVGASSGVLSVAHLVSSFAGFFATAAFDPHLICSEGGQSGCIDIVGTIGGTDRNDQSGGIIGSLTSGIYLPLMSLIVIWAAFTIGYNGIVKREIRKSFGQALWVFFSFVIGLTFLFNPWMLAKAPISVSNTLSGCIILSFGGQSCLSSTDTLDNEDNEITEDLCAANAPNTAGTNEIMTLITTNLSCQVWKAFVLEPYAQGSFGQPLSELNVFEPGMVLAGALEGKNNAYKEKFCVSTTVARPLDNQNNSNGELELRAPNANGANKICNLAVYQLFLKTQAAAYAGNSGEHYQGANTHNLVYDGIASGDRKVDARWYNIIDVTSMDDGMWGIWSEGKGEKVSISILALLSAVLGSFVIIAVAITAIMYYLSSIILMAFAPLFFMFGVHPGKGRDYLKGYGEMVLSNVFKYVASALFLIVVLSIYGGVLGSSEGFFTTLLFVIIMSLALWLYRKEIIELLGRVDMGGKTLSNKMSQVGGDAGKFAASIGGSTVGAVLAGDKSVSGIAKNLVGGAKEGVNREFKAGRVPGMGDVGKSFVRNSAQTYADVENQNRRDAGKKAEENKATATEHEEKREELQATFEQDSAEYATTVAALRDMENRLQEINTKLAETSPNKVLEDIKNEGTDGEKFAQVVQLNPQIQEKEREIKSAQDRGLPPEKIAALQVERQGMVDKRADKIAELEKSGMLDDYTARYTNAYADYEELSTQGVELYDEYTDKRVELDPQEKKLKATQAALGEEENQVAYYSDKADAFSQNADKKFGQSSRARKIKKRTEGRRVEKKRNEYAKGAQDRSVEENAVTFVDPQALDNPADPRMARSEEDKKKAPILPDLSQFKPKPTTDDTNYDDDGQGTLFDIPDENDDTNYDDDGQGTLFGENE